tara:strand:- start:9802 stop:10242 length:441 start_codon:yes stop_codon:yes gene_type:complete
VSKYIHPITLEAAIEVASNLRSDDLRELQEGHGYDPIEYAKYAAQESSTVYFTMPNSRIAGMGGIGEGGLIWMLCTPVIHKYPITFVKTAKGYLKSSKEPLLHNVVDARNKVHLKLLKYLGFKFLRKISFGPNQLPFIEFCRVCRS